MNDAGTLIGGMAALAVFVFGGVLAIYWAVLPLVIIRKFNRLISQSHETNSHLAVVSHQLTVQNRPPAPPVVAEESPQDMATGMATPE